MKRAIWLGVGLAMGLAANAAAQAYSTMGNFGFGFPFRWESRCEKPFLVFAPATSDDVDQFNRQFGQYTACLKRHADNDAEFASTQVYKDAVKELEDVKDDARRRGLSIR